MKNVNVHRILVPVDFSEAGESALNYGTFLANKYRADIFLLHILEGINSYPSAGLQIKAGLRRMLLRQRLVKN